MARNLKKSEDINVKATDTEISLEFARKMYDATEVEEKVTELNKTITEKADALSKKDDEIKKSEEALKTKVTTLEEKVEDIANFNFDDVVVYSTCTDEELQAAIAASD